MPHDHYDQPKVLLFDIGGVCVKSPMQAILDYELAHGIPPGWVNHSISATSPSGFWHRLETGSIPLDEDFFEGFHRDLHNETRWASFYKRQQHNNALGFPEKVPPLPNIDAKALFNDMMAISEEPDPFMFPALNRLRKDGSFILAALSNTVLFPQGHALYREDPFNHPVRRIFDVFVSSAHVGLRKPDPLIYQLALKLIDEFSRNNAGTSRAQGRNWDKGVQPAEVLFFDDIGENLKSARRLGFRTIKVNLGKTYLAVAELECITGLALKDENSCDNPKPIVSAEGRPRGKAKI